MDEYLLKARLDDAIKLSYKSQRFLGFLDPAEAEYLKSLLKFQNEVEYKFWGGFQEAERQFLSVSREQITNESFPISAITLSFREVDKLNHRDFLGSFMSQGVTRNSLGDILVENGRAIVFVKNELVEYFTVNLRKIGKVGIKSEIGYKEPLPTPHSFLDLGGVIASQRADCVIAFLMKSSREKAANAIKSGIVTCNYKELDSVSQKINEEDKISIRGTGKFLVTNLGPFTKKERLIIKCKKYI